MAHIAAGYRVLVLDILSNFEWLKYFASGRLSFHALASQADPGRLEFRPWALAQTVRPGRHCTLYCLLIIFDCVLGLGSCLGIGWRPRPRLRVVEGRHDNLVALGLRLDSLIEQRARLTDLCFDGALPIGRLPLCQILQLVYLSLGLPRLGLC